MVVARTHTHTQVEQRGVDYTIPEYIVKVLQYGYLTIFAAAFPLGPLALIITYVADLRLDAGRLLWVHKRPLPRRAENIGAWGDIVTFLSIVAVVNNGFLIAYTSSYG